MEPASTIIRKLGGEAIVSGATNTAKTAPYRWQYPRERGGTGGIIPHWYVPVLIKFARDRGVCLSEADFAPAPAGDGVAA